MKIREFSKIYKIRKMHIFELRRRLHAAVPTASRNHLPSALSETVVRHARLISRRQVRACAVANKVTLSAVLDGDTLAPLSAVRPLPPPVEFTGQTGVVLSAPHRNILTTFAPLGSSSGVARTATKTSSSSSSFDCSKT